MLPSQPNQSLMDGLACLQAVVVQPEPIGSRELARQLGLEPTRVNRLLKTLAHLGFTEQDSRRRYRAGPGVHVLAAQSLYASGLHDRAIGPLEELRRSGHFVAFGVLWRHLTCYLYTAPPNSSVTPTLVPPRPAYVSAVGMSLLAQRPEAEIRALYATGEIAHPTYPGVKVPPLEGRNGLLAQLERIRRQGYALVARPPMLNIAVDVGNPPYASLGIDSEITEREVPGVVEVLRETARQILGDSETPAAAAGR